MFNHAPADYQDPFLIIAKGTDFAQVDSDPDDVFYRDSLITAFVSSICWEGNEGNVLIIPNEAYENLYDIPEKVLAEVHVFSKRVALAMRTAYECDGITIQQHNEPAGNQEVWHYHVHVLPRYEGDDLYVRYNEKHPSDPKERKRFATMLREQLSNAK